MNTSTLSLRRVVAVILAGFTLGQPFIAHAAQYQMRMSTPGMKPASAQPGTPVEPTTPQPPVTPPAPEPEPFVLNDGQFSVDPVLAYSGLVGATYSVTVRVKNVGAAVAMKAYPSVVTGDNVVGTASTAAVPIYCPVMTSMSRTLAVGGTCQVMLSMKVPKAGTTTGYFSIGATRVPMISVGYTSSELSSFTATPNVYTTTEAASGHFADYIDVTLKNTSSVDGGLSVTNLTSGSSVQYISNTCGSVPAGGTCQVRLVYDNYFAPSTFSYPITINGIVRNADGSKTASTGVPLTLNVTPAK